MLSGWKRNLLIAFVLVGVAVAAVWLNRTAGRRALERRKAELRANGEQLTYAEWSGGKRETNGTARSQTIFSLASQLPHVGNFPLGPVNEMMSLETPGRARVVWRRTELPAVASRGSNVVALSWSEAAEEIADAGETLRLLRAELASPPLDMGWDYDSDPLGAPRINYVALRNGAQWLAGATLVALHHGDTTNALEHWRTLFALARMHAREPTLVSQMIRVAIGGLGLSAAWEMLQTPGLTEEQLAAMQSELLCVDFARTVANASESERALGLALFAEFRSNPSHNFNVVQSTKSVAGLGDQIYWSGWRGGFADADELFYLDQFQMTIEAGRLLIGGRPWKEVDLQLTNLYANNRRVAKSWPAFTRPLSSVMFPAPQKTMLVGSRNETLRQMTLAAIALRRHELRHGKLPDELDALVPEFLPTLPHDCFSDRPLRYRLNADGTFTLYSVGEDGKDDGGDARPKTPPKAGASWQLWDGADAVWPRAADEPKPSPP